MVLFATKVEKDGVGGRIVSAIGENRKRHQAKTDDAHRKPMAEEDPNESVTVRQSRARSLKSTPNWGDLGCSQLSALKS